MSVLQWYVVFSCALNAVLTVAMIGKPKKPTTPGQAAIFVVFSALVVVFALTWWAP